MTEVTRMRWLVFQWTYIFLYRILPYTKEKQLEAWIIFHSHPYMDVCKENPHKARNK